MVNSSFETIVLRKNDDWLRAVQTIKSGTSDVFIVDRANVSSDCGERLRQHAATEGWGICAATTETSFNVIGGRSLRVWSSGRRIVSTLGHTCELSNAYYGDLQTKVKSAGPKGSESIWGGGVYITREALKKIEGLDTSYVEHVGAQVPNIVWDDLCLQARLAGVTVGCHPEVFSEIDASAVQYPNESPSYMLWESKWGWHPIYPNVYAIRARWQGTPLVRGIFEDLLDPASTCDMPPVEGMMMTMDAIPKLRLTLAALAKTDYPNFKLIVLMNGSSEAVREELENQKANFPFPMTLLRAPVNIGVSPGMNWLKSQCTAPVLVKLDDDIEMPSHWLKEMVGILKRHPFCGAVLPTWHIPTSTGKMAMIAQLRVHPNFCGVDPIEFAAPPDSLHLTNFMGGACVVYRKKAFDLAGAYDLRFAPTQNDDVDHGLSLRAAGYDVMEEGGLVFIHHTNFAQGASFSSSFTLIAQRGILRNKWGRALQVLETSLDRYGRVVQLRENA